MADPRPNILLLCTDQQRADTIAALGNPLVRTPALDRLCCEGTAFTRAYTPSPVCISARCCMATGLYAHQSGCVNNSTAPAPDVPSVMERLRDSGYQTAGIGKMHFRPDAHRLWGFEQRITSEGGPFASGTGDNYHDYLRGLGLDEMEDPHGLLSEYYYIPQPSLVPARYHHTQWIADRSTEFLRQRDRSRPFFLWASYLKPHPPFESPTPWNRLYRAAEMPDPVGSPDAATVQLFWNRFQNRYKYRDAGTDAWLLRTMRAAYYASISYIDYSIGQILDGLGDEIDNTLIVFTSDHGEMLGDFGCFGKRCMLDASARVPLLARWPKALPASERCEVPASLIDLFATFSTVAGAGGELPRHSRSLIDLAAGRVDRPFVVSQYDHRRFGLYMLASDHQKYIYSAADHAELFIDNRIDPSEATNLIGDSRCTAAAGDLKRALLDLLRADGYCEPVDGDDWKAYPTARFFPEPRQGVLYQDGRDLQSRIDQLGPGYARDVMRSGFQNRDVVFGD